jgi:HK97 family phage portal protein
MGVLSTIRSRVTGLLTVARGDPWWPIVREPYTGAWQHNDPLTAESAVLNPSVFAVVSRIAADIGKIAPPLLLERDANGFWSETQNPAYSPVLRKPNHYQTPQQFHEQITASLLLQGNAYLLKHRDDRGVVNQLDVLDPARVKVLVAPDSSVYYELQSNELAGLPNETQPVVAPAREVIHLRWNCWGHPLIGLSPLAAISGAVSQAQAIQSSSTAFFQSGGRAPFALVAPTKLDPLSAARVKDEALKFRTSGTLVLDLGMELKPLQTSAVDMQLIAQLGWTEETIAKVFGMPVSIINSTKQPPYANAEASQLQYISNCLQPHMTAIAAGLTAGLELPSYLKIEFDDTLLTWMDSQSRTMAARNAIVSGMSPNEVRATFYDLGPVEGGDSPYLQQQNWPVDQLADRERPAPAPGSIPVAAEEPAPV